MSVPIDLELSLVSIVPAGALFVDQIRPPPGTSADGSEQPSGFRSRSSFFTPQAEVEELLEQSTAAEPYVGVGKTHLASALGHNAVRRKYRVLSVRADQMLKKLKAARLDKTCPLELRMLLRVDLLIVDDSRCKRSTRPRLRTSTRSSLNTIRCRPRS